MTIFIVGSFFVSLMLFLYIMLLRMTRKTSVVDKLKDYDEQQLSVTVKRNKTMQADGPIKRISRIFVRSRSSARKRKKILLIRQANLKISYEELLVIKWMLTISFVLLVVLLTKDVVLITIVTFITWLSPDFLLLRMKNKRIIEFDQQLTEALIMISNALKAGYSFLQALAVAAEEAGDPLSSEFKILLKELSLGIPLEDGLANFLDRMPSDDLKLIINAILIQKDVGGNLSEILENISGTIRDRQQIKNEVRSLTAQGRLSGLIIMVMPFFLGIVIYIFDPNYIMTLFNTLIGRFLLILAIVNQVIGWLFIRKIIKIDY